jgi:hypothetical protein
MWLSGACTPRTAGACDRFKYAVDDTIDVEKAASLAAFFVALSSLARAGAGDRKISLSD